MSEATPFLLETGEYQQLEKDPGVKSHRKAAVVSFRKVLLLGAVSFISIAINITQWAMLSRPDLYGNCRLSLSGLDLDVEKPFGPTKWSKVPETHDLSALDEHWFNMNTWVGTIALPKDLHAGGSLPFPWDESKNVYNINAFHNLHCLQRIYENVRELQQGVQSNMSFMHTVHCLDTLRSEIICVADDTPTSFEQSGVQREEKPPPRKCRDWNKMIEFAKKNSACFKRFPPSDPRWNTRDAFTYCPDDSPYWDQVNEYKLTKQEEWGDPVE